MSREKDFIKNIGILAFGTVVPKMTSFITLPLYTAYLSKSDYGTFDLISTLAVLFIPLATLQIQSAAFRYLLEVRNDICSQKKIISNTFLFMLPVMCLAILILSLILSRQSSGVRILVCVYCFLDAFMNALGQVARGLNKSHVYSAGVIVSSIMNLTLSSVFLMHMGMGLSGLLISLCLANTGAICVSAVCLRIWNYMDIHIWDFKLVKEMLGYSLGLIPNMISSWIVNLSDRTLIVLFMGVSANAVYAVANKIPNMFNLVQSTFSMSWQESASLAVKDGDAEDYYSEMFFNMFGIFYGVMACLIASTPITFKVLIRGEYSDAYAQMGILYLGCFFSVLSTYLGGIYVAHKRTKNQGLTTMSAAAANLLINLCFIHRIGLYAASLSTFFSYFLLFVYRMFHIRTFQKIRFHYIRIFCSASALVMMSRLCVMRIWWVDVINGIFAVTSSIILNIGFVKSFFKKQGKKVF